MAKLIATHPAKVPVEYELRAECRLECDSKGELSLTDGQATGEHVWFRQIGGKWVVQDCGLISGTRLNNIRLAPKIARVLVSGDCVATGEWRLIFYEELTAPLPQQALPAPASTASTQHVTIQIIGRDPACDIVLDQPDVAHRHCRIVRTPQGSELEDLGSPGTYVNGVRLTERKRLQPDDVVGVGTALFIFRNNALDYVNPNKIDRLDAIGLCTSVRKAGKSLRLLQDIHLVIEAQQFVAVVGASGSGKSTLLNALTGFRKADEGTVLLNGFDYYANPDLFRASIGYVPQDDIVHRELSVANVLRYAALLRLPPDTKNHEIERMVDSTLQELKLSHRKEASVSTLSGGERKRVNVGVELLTRPNLLFLDEPTSGLDPGLEMEFIGLVRQLTLEGRTIIMTTHATSSIAACDRVLFLARGGRVAYFGPPSEALAYFEVDHFADAYVRLNRDDQTPEFWEKKFRQSALYDRYIRTPQQSGPEPHRGKTKKVASKISAAKTRTSALHQFIVLVRRYVATLRGDVRNLTFLLAQAPVIALLLMAIFPADLFAIKYRWLYGLRFQRAPMLLFCIVISTLLFSIVNACRELTKERPIYRRERLVNLRLWPYLFSKIFVLSALIFVQSVVLMFLISQKVDFGVDNFVWLQMITVVCLASWTGIMLGLLVSSVAASNDQAVSLVPVIVLPQILFSGLIDLETLSLLRVFTPSYWAYAALGNLTRLPGNEMFKQSPLRAGVMLVLLSLLPLLLCYRQMESRDRQFR